MFQFKLATVLKLHEVQRKFLILSPTIILEIKFECIPIFIFFKKKNLKTQESEMHIVVSIYYNRKMKIKKIDIYIYIYT